MKTIPTLEATVLRMKTEIQADQAAGIVPQQVKSFSELHNYVDANEYGGFCEEGRNILSEESVAFANEAQNQVDKWLSDLYSTTIENRVGGRRHAEIDDEEGNQEAYDRREGERRKRIDEHARRVILNKR